MLDLSPSLLLGLIFLIGYLAIIFEHFTRVDKSAAALFTGTVCWIFYLNQGTTPFDLKLENLGHHLSDISQILFFLLSAMLIVEVIDTHRGFDMIGKYLFFDSPKKLFWTFILIAFFLSAVLDNLTTAIVMLSLLRKIVPERNQRLLYTAALIPAVNAGGAWTPIGDVTTTMLWISDRISGFAIMKNLFVPSFVSLLIAGFGLSLFLPKKIDLRPKVDLPHLAWSRRILAVGMLGLISVPILKATLNVPPFLGILFALAVIWVVTDLVNHREPERHELKLLNLLSRIDLSSILFFLGILLSIDALESIGVLRELATTIDTHVGSYQIVALLIGLVSAVVDNIPLVAACIKMYPLEAFPTDHPLWNLIAYCAGTGGSILIIGSAPGVALMSMEKISFGWYLKYASGVILLSYFAGVIAYIALNSLSV